MGDIGKHFDRAEFACKCGCGFNTISQELVDRLDVIREKLQQPIKIMSGCRCEKRNKEVGGEQNSDHLRGNAVDIYCGGSTFRFVIVKLAYNLDFKRIGLYAKEPIVHLSVDKENPQIVLWVR